MFICIHCIWITLQTLFIPEDPLLRENLEKFLENFPKASLDELVSSNCLSNPRMNQRKILATFSEELSDKLLVKNLWRWYLKKYGAIFRNLRNRGKLWKCWKQFSNELLELLEFLNELLRRNFWKKKMMKILFEKFMKTFFRVPWNNNRIYLLRSRWTNIQWNSLRIFLRTNISDKRKSLWNP